MRSKTKSIIGDGTNETSREDTHVHKAGNVGLYIRKGDLDMQATNSNAGGDDRDGALDILERSESTRQLVVNGV